MGGEREEGRGERRERGERGEVGGEKGDGEVRGVASERLGSR